MSDEPKTLPRKKSSRILELDAIRALTCLNLLLFHFTYVYQHKYGFASELGFSFPYGKYGVQLFFMLSGLVNALTLIKKKKPGQFLASRCIRILPAYWLVIAMNLVLFSCFTMFNETIRVDATLANLTTLPNLLGYENMEPVTWTLQVEMLFYVLILGLFLLGLLEKPLKTMMVAITICLASCYWFDWFRAQYPESNWNGYFHVIDSLFLMRNLPLFAMGILLNELRCQRGKPIQLWLGIIASGIVFHLIDLRDHNPAVTVMLMAMLTAGAYGKLPFLRFKPLIYISFISYPLYLFHNNLGSALMKWVETFGVAPIPTILIATLFSIGVATVVTYWFEQPITRWLRGIFISKNKLTTPSSQQPSPASSPEPETGNAKAMEATAQELGDVIQAEQLLREIESEQVREQEWAITTDRPVNQHRDES